MDIKQSILLSFAIITMLVLLFVIVFGDKGVADLYFLKQEKKILNRKNDRLERENIELYRATDRLKNDLDFIENVARQELGMIGEDEVIIKMKNGKKK